MGSRKPLTPPKNVALDADNLFIVTNFDTFQKDQYVG